MGTRSRSTRRISDLFVRRRKQLISQPDKSRLGLPFVWVAEILVTLSMLSTPFLMSLKVGYSELKYPGVYHSQRFSIVSSQLSKGFWFCFSRSFSGLEVDFGNLDLASSSSRIIDEKALSNLEILYEQKENSLVVR